MGWNHGLHAGDPSLGTPGWATESLGCVSIVLVVTASVTLGTSLRTAELWSQPCKRQIAIAWGPRGKDALAVPF